MLAIYCFNSGFNQYFTGIDSRHFVLDIFLSGFRVHSVIGHF